MFNKKIEWPYENSVALEGCSFEIIWDANPFYWGGKIKIIDVYINTSLLYYVSIPQDYKSQSTSSSLPLQTIANNEQTESMIIPYFTINNLSEIDTIELKAGIFSAQEENVLSKSFTPNMLRDFHVRRSDVSMNLNVSSLQHGKHYKIFVNHTMEQPSHSAFWQGKFLGTVIEEVGTCKQTAIINPPPSFLINPNLL
jgi:hypothetical protein